jgi:hypothetical protein
MFSISSESNALPHITVLFCGVVYMKDITDYLEKEQVDQVLAAAGRAGESVYL